MNLNGELTVFEIYGFKLYIYLKHNAVLPSIDTDKMLQN